MALSEDKDIFSNCDATLQKMILYIPNVDLVNDKFYTKFGLNKSIRSQDNEKKRILTSIKGHNSVANLQKMTIYNPNIDFVNDNVYTTFGKILSIHSQDIEQKLNSDFNQGP